MPRRCDDAILNTLNPLLAAMKADDLLTVIEIANSLSFKERRPVIESSVCIGFRLGYQFEILDWCVARRLLSSFATSSILFFDPIYLFVKN